MAQNNKHIRRRIEGLQSRILQHKGYIRSEPTARARDHWLREIEAWENEIRRLLRRLERKP